MYPSLVVATAASCSWLAESSRRQAGSWNQASTATTRSAVLCTLVPPLCDRGASYPRNKQPSPDPPRPITNPRNHIDPCLATKINHSKHRVIFIPCPFVFPVLSFFFCRKSNLTTVCGRMNGTTQVRARARFCHDHPTSIVAWN